MCKDKQLRKQEMLFLIALYLEIVAMLVGITTLQYMGNQQLWLFFLKIIRYLGYLLVIIKIINDDYDSKTIMLIGAIVAIACAISINVGNNVLICSMLFVIGMHDLEFDTIAENVVKIYLVGMLIVIFLSLIGLIPDWVYFEGNRTRHSLGYIYPSHATSYIFYCILLFCYTKKDKLSIWHVILLEAFNLWQYKYTNSRAGTLLMIIVPIAFWIIKHKNKQIIHKIIYIVAKWIFVICALFSYTASILFNKVGVFAKIDKIINNRFRMGHKALINYGFPLFGEKIKWIGNGGVGYIRDQLQGEYNFVDCSYIKIMLDYGVLFFLIILIGFTLAGIYAQKKQDYFLALALCFIAVYSIIEPRLIELGINPFVLMLVVLVDNIMQRREIKIVSKDMI